MTDLTAIHLTQINSYCVVTLQNQQQQKKDSQVGGTFKHLHNLMNI